MQFTSTNISVESFSEIRQVTAKLQDRRCCVGTKWNWKFEDRNVTARTLFTPSSYYILLIFCLNGFIFLFGICAEDSRFCFDSTVHVWPKLLLRSQPQLWLGVNRLEMKFGVNSDLPCASVTWMKSCDQLFQKLISKTFEIHWNKLMSSMFVPTHSQSVVTNVSLLSWVSSKLIHFQVADHSDLMTLNSTFVAT